ncbi:fasciclin domain-containing protein [Flavihumibacter petaseus]|uniref:FAS1 domain-containing protein n=1 Tax=Flavihumibacter petaseus NBRC 106054 TaxID=1220578 RepID=A0A0E9N635_9BACT|nr:fasciclin domain-containing protein [Flavihumibacter petaseus]GAO45166.1 hypothetical protein FPE01S_04_04100 [Flavihumibacter petaseus NBRC 106054]
MPNRIPFARPLLLAAAFAALALTRCSDDDDDPTPPQDKNIAQVITDRDDFSTLEAAMVKGDMTATLSGAGPMTLFAPDNAAFDAAGITTTVLTAMSVDEVENMLQYHLLGSRIDAASLPAGPNAKVLTAQGDSLWVTRNANGTYVNGSLVEEADIAATNGLLHRIGYALVPPSGDMVEVVQTPDNGLDSLAKALQRANDAPGGNPDLINTLKASVFTVFAPSNAAFTELLTGLGVTDINDIPVANLLGVLGYHVVPGRSFSSDLSNGALTMYAGGTTTVNLSDGINGGPTITGTGNTGNKSNITKVNWVATNGVIHVIDRVLLP